ncbi:MAG TPA: hypothetical protein VK639_12895 [Terriglobales bacterium]|nr:hypothetical protein [Terriglobales bacterium]
MDRSSTFACIKFPTSSLVSDVASGYFQLRELDLELEISRRTLGSRTDSLRLTQILADGGATSMLDVRQAEQLVYAAAASIPDLERRIEQQENFISILLGNNPQAIAVPQGYGHLAAARCNRSILISVPALIALSPTRYSFELIETMLYRTFLRCRVQAEISVRHELVKRQKL